METSLPLAAIGVKEVGMEWNTNNIKNNTE
jgi:hypothetical protein